jgi:hypothetical protein
MQDLAYPRSHASDWIFPDVGTHRTRNHMLLCRIKMRGCEMPGTRIAPARYGGPQEEPGFTTLRKTLRRRSAWDVCRVSWWWLSAWNAEHYSWRRSASACLSIDASPSAYDEPNRITPIPRRCSCLEACNIGLRFARKHPQKCISIQPQIIPTVGDACRTGPGPQDRGITWSYARSCIRTSQNSPSTHSGE